jgi:phasin
LGGIAPEEARKAVAAGETGEATRAQDGGSLSDLLLGADVEPDDGSRVIAGACLALALAPTILHPPGGFAPPNAGWEYEGRYMTMTFNPDAAANNKKTETANKNETFNPLAQFESMKLDTAIPEAMRAFAGTAVMQSREAYEHAKTTLDAGIEAIERSYDAAGHAATALNRKIIDIAQRNVNSGFDLAKSLASAKNLAEMVELQGAYWRKQLEALMAQAEEVRELSVNASVDVAEPLKRHATHQAEQVRAMSKKVTAEAAEAIRRQASNLEQDLRRAS